MSAEDPTIELQSQFAFLEQTVDTLNEVVIEQERTIEALGKRLSSLEQRLRGTGDSNTAQSDPLEERPPHY